MNPVRTLAATKATFFSAYPRPINAVYRRVVEELLVELHLTTVNSAFTYDPFFALGLVTLYDGLMEAYHPLNSERPFSTPSVRLSTSSRRCCARMPAICSS